MVFEREIPENMFSEVSISEHSIVTFLVSCIDFTFPMLVRCYYVGVTLPDQLNAEFNAYLPGFHLPLARFP